MTVAQSGGLMFLIWYSSLSLSLDFHNPSDNIAGKPIYGEMLTIILTDASSLFLLVCCCLGAFHCITAPIAQHYTWEKCLPV